MPTPAPYDSTEGAAIGTPGGRRYFTTSAPGPGAGSCCVRQCSVPSPHTRSTAWIPTTVCAGMSRAIVSSATRSCRIVEGRHDHDTVGEIEVGVARREALPLHHHGPRKRQRDGAEWPRRLAERVGDAAGCPSTACDCRRPDPLRPREPPRRRSRTGQCRRRGRGYRRRRSLRRARSSRWPPARSGRLPRSRPVPDPGFCTWTSLSSHSSVTRISPRPLTSMPPPSRTIRPPVSARTGSSMGSPVMRGDGASDLRVPGVVVVLRPAIEGPRCEDDVAALGQDPGRRRIAEPSSIGRDDVETETIRTDGMGCEDALSGFADVVRAQRISTGSCAASTRAISA